MKVETIDGSTVTPLGRERCPDVLTSLSAEVVSAAFSGAPVARCRAVASMTVGQRLSLFPPACACGVNHYGLAENMARVVAKLSPAELEAVNELPYPFPLRELISLAAVPSQRRALFLATHGMRALVKQKKNLATRNA